MEALPPRGGLTLLGIHWPLPFKNELKGEGPPPGGSLPLSFPSRLEPEKGY